MHATLLARLVLAVHLNHRALQRRLLGLRRRGLLLHYIARSAHLLGVADHGQLQGVILDLASDALVVLVISPTLVRLLRSKQLLSHVPRLEGPCAQEENRAHRRRFLELDALSEENIHGDAGVNASLVASRRSALRQVFHAIGEVRGVLGRVASHCLHTTMFAGLVVQVALVLFALEVYGPATIMRQVLRQRNRVRTELALLRSMNLIIRPRNGT